MGIFILLYKKKYIKPQQVSCLYSKSNRLMLKSSKHRTRMPKTLRLTRRLSHLMKKQMSYGNVKEQRDVANLNKGNEAGWDMAKLDEEKAEESKTAGAKAGAGVKRQGAAFGEGTSWSKPSFGRKAPPGGTKFGKDDFAALDDLDDEDSGKKKDTKTRAEGGGQANSGAQREEKEEKRPVK